MCVYLYLLLCLIVWGCVNACVSDLMLVIMPDSLYVLIVLRSLFIGNRNSGAFD